jgi:hypothetical protein
VKTLTVRLPERLVSDLESESQRRRCTKSDIVRERLMGGGARRARDTGFHILADLVGSVDGLPADLSARRKSYLRATGYGRKRPR